jgi:hypothetical protein
MELAGNEIVKLVEKYKQLTADLTAELLMYKVKHDVLQEELNTRNAILRQIEADRAAQRDPRNE